MDGNNTMAQSVWEDFDHFNTYYIPKQTIPILRLFADKIFHYGGINIHLKSQERKSDLVTKVQSAFITMKNQDDKQRYLTVRRECETIKTQRMPNTSVMPAPTFGGVPTSSSGIVSGSSSDVYRSNVAGYARPVAGAVTRPSVSGWQPSSSSTGYNRAQPSLLDWKPSPMWKPIKALTNMEMLPDISSSESPHTRREKKAHFSLSPDVIEKLNLTKANPTLHPHYSIRLFCTSSDHYRPLNMAPHPGAPPVTNRIVPIEYPLNPDAVLDDHIVPFKERGLRGKAGSAPPLDLDKGVRGIIRIPGRMASVVLAHSGPTVSKKKEFSKKFWFQVVFAEMTTLEDLLTKLEQLPPSDAATELQRLRQRAAEDDDIEVGNSTLSLKDPLSGMRIVKPVRSSRCSHVQCFDARWWLEANRNHPQWLCPHCNKELDFETIICDGFFLNILNAVPEYIDEVILESNGDWHSENGQYGSPSWMSANGVTAQPVVTKRERSESTSPVKGKRKAIEILSSDSDDGESISRRINGRTSSSHPSNVPSDMRQTASASRPSSAQPVAAAVIDLTLSSDEEEDGDNEDNDGEQEYLGGSGAIPPSRAVAESEARPTDRNHRRGVDPWVHLPLPSVPLPAKSTGNGPSQIRAQNWMDEYLDLPVDSWDNDDSYM